MIGALFEALRCTRMSSAAPEYGEEVFNRIDPLSVVRKNRKWISHSTPPKLQLTPVASRGRDVAFRIDPVAVLAGRGCNLTRVKTPYRIDLLPMASSATNNEQLQFQGTGKFAWSAIVNRNTAKVTITIADRMGAYVIFGQRKVAGASQRCIWPLLADSALFVLTNVQPSPFCHDR